MERLLRSQSGPLPLGVCVTLFAAAREPDHRRRSRLRRMWPVVITVVIVVPLLVLAWWQVRRR